MAQSLVICHCPLSHNWQYQVSCLHDQENKVPFGKIVDLHKEEKNNESSYLYKNVE